MKYVIILYDGMADQPLQELGGRTPMMAAQKPNLDRLAMKSEVGLVKTVGDGLKPSSDVANLSIMGYDPHQYYSGRSPLEAVSIGIQMKDDDIALRCNLVTLSEKEPYENKRMVDYCADDISSPEAAVLMEAVQTRFGNEHFHFFPGVSYRHCLLWHQGETRLPVLTQPHDIIDRVIGEYLAKDPVARPLLDMMRESYTLLKDHPVNQARIARGKRPANAIWLWGQGTKPRLEPFASRFGRKGSVVSAVDLIKGIGICAGMHVVEVPGATGYIDTNFVGKAQAALRELRDGQDFVYIHLEAPDECGHRHEIENKVKSIELIDEQVLGVVLEGLEDYEDYKLMILPDHATPLALRTHTSDPVPYLIYHKCGEIDSGVASLDEDSAKSTGNYVAVGHTLIEHFLQD